MRRESSAPTPPPDRPMKQVLIRLIRVAQIIAKDSRQPENVARANEIIALAEIIQKEIPHDVD